MKLIELQIKNFGCIDENGITIKMLEKQHQ